ncbi:hypothetical protein M758_UG181500 [Ceratodon purpureus]|nr:hypothetical protein M758_UG181500 [Ceratodon purpureus]
MLRSLNQQVNSVQTNLKSISQRQDTLEHRLDANVSGMDSMERKLDLVLQMQASLIRSINAKETLNNDGNCCPSREDKLSTRRDMCHACKRFVDCVANTFGMRKKRRLVQVHPRTLGGTRLTT